jgi:hypothetical protein
MRHLIERLEGTAVAEARKPYVPQSREDRQETEALLHREVADAANEVRNAWVAMEAVLKRATAFSAQVDTPEGTFAETWRQMGIRSPVEFLKRVATDHLRWNKNIWDALKGA